MSRQFDSRKDSKSTKFERRTRIFVNLSFRELCDSKLSGLRETPAEIAVGTHFHAQTWH